MYKNDITIKAHKSLYKLLALIFTLSFCGCEKLFEIHPYDGKVSGETNINAKNISRIESACKDKTTIRFVMMGDSQRWYDETKDFVKNVNNMDDIDFVVHGGDISDFGLTDEFMWVRDLMNKLKVPYVTLLGNHDCLGTGKQVYRKIFGEENFSFMAGNIKFVCLNTNAIEYDYSHPVPDFGYIESQYIDQNSSWEKTVFVMHARPYSEQFDNNVARGFQEFIKRFPNLQFCLNAHGHTVKHDDLFNDGVIYHGVQNIGKRGYFIFTITPDDYTYEEIQF